MTVKIFKKKEISALPEIWESIISISNNDNVLHLILEDGTKTYIPFCNFYRYEVVGGE